ncbi:MAG: hypothetical protein AAGF85_09025 [Bacteroidota bacterium]
MAFDGKEGKPITLEQAKRWTKRYRDENEGAVKAQFFGCEHIQKILDEPGCMGIRVYYGIDDEGNPKLMLVGAKSDQNNILPTSEGKDGDEGIILDDGANCPDQCPTGSDPLTD